MKEFKIGDRVRVYDRFGNGIGEIIHIDGELVEVSKPKGKIIAHIKQCRRLKQKPKSVRVTRKTLSLIFDQEVPDVYSEKGLNKKPWLENICKRLGL